jgi:hypothetical protein
MKTKPKQTQFSKLTRRAGQFEMEHGTWLDLDLDDVLPDNRDLFHEPLGSGSV